MSIKKIVESSWFDRTILAIVLVNTIILGMQTSPKLNSEYGTAMELADNICLGLFIAEMSLKLFAYRHRYFCSAWNLFDFTIIAISLFAALPAVQSMRAFRVIRSVRVLRAMKSAKSLRLLSSVDSLQVITSALVKSCGGMVGASMMLAVVFYIYALIGTNIFSTDSPVYFGTLGGSIFTLFQIMTGDDWSNICRPLMEIYSWAWFYFVSFIFLSTFVILNIVTGVVVDAVMAAKETDNINN